MPKYNAYSDVGALQSTDLLGISRSPFTPGTFYTTTPNGVVNYVNANAQIAESQVTNLTTDLAGKIASTQKGAASGVASLDSNTRLTNSQTPLKTFNVQSGTSYTATTTDINNVISCSNVSICNITLPSDATNPNIPIGATFEARATVAPGVVSWFADVGVTIEFSAFATSTATFQTIIARKIASNRYACIWGGNKAGFQSISFGATTIITADGAGGLAGSFAKIDANGVMTNIAQPAFLAYNSTSRNSVTGDGTNYLIPYNNTDYDQNSNFNTMSGTFTAPVAGKYHFDTHNIISNITASGATGIILTLVTSTKTFEIFAASASIHDPNGNAIVNGGANPAMAAGDTAVIKIEVWGGTKVVNVANTLYDTVFSGYLIC